MAEPGQKRPRRETFKIVVGIFAAAVLGLGFLLFWQLFNGAQSSFKTFGIGFLSGRTWDPAHNVFGALPFLYGTLISSLIALLISVPVSLGIAIFLTERAPRTIRKPLTILIELLAAVPSIVIGLWGLFILAPFLRQNLAPFLSTTSGFLPLFSGTFYGPSLLTGGLVLAIMVIPITASVCKEAIAAVPPSQREAALALGSTPWEATRTAILPYARSGIIGAIVLGFGRSIGETMAVTMVIGNSPMLSASLFAPAYTLASVIANEFVEATGPLYISSLIHIGLVLLGVSIAINVLARILVRQYAQTAARYS